MTVWQERQRSSAATLEDHGFVDDRTMGVFKWLEWVVMRNHALAEVDDPLTRAIVRLDPISSRSLLNYIGHVASGVGQKISSSMGEAFGIMLDGWSSGTTHYVGMYGVFVKDSKRHQPLLAISPAEHGQSAAAHVEMIENVLQMYDKDTSMIHFLVGDNCSTNKALANLLGVPLIGCASHRYNLAVALFLDQHRVAIDKVSELCSALRQPNNAMALSSHTRLKALKANATRWSSTFRMLKRYVEIRDAVKLVQEVEDLVPSPGTHRQIVQLVGQLEDINSVCVLLQDEERTIADVRVLFDAVALKYPVMADKLKADASIVHAPDFESACVKVATGRTLNAAEAAAVSRFAVERPTEKPSSKNFAVDALRKAKKPRVATTSYSELLDAIPPTSNRCERLFSQCKFVLTPTRSSLLPENFEKIVFLRANRELWSYGSLLGLSEQE